MDKADFAHIYEEFFPRMYIYVFHRVNDVITTEDLISQIFFKALKNLEKYDTGKGQVSTWLYTIASHVLIDYYRKDDSIESINEEHEDSIASEENLNEEIDFETNFKQIVRALGKLPARTQEIITLRIFEELSFVEIAKIIGIGESGVKMGFARGINIIKNSMNIMTLFISLLFI